MSPRIWPAFVGIAFLLQTWTVQADVEKLAREFQSTKKSLVSTEVRQRKVLGTLFEINRKMKKIVSEKGSLEQQKLEVRGNVQELAAKIIELNQKTKLQKSQLRGRLTTIYKLGGQGLARILFSSTSSSQLERNLKILGIVAGQDVELIKDYSKTRKELEKRKQKLSLRWAHLQKLESKIQKQENLLTSENEAKRHLLEQVKKSREFAMMKLTDIRKQTRNLAEEEDSGLLDLLFKPSFFEQKGRLPTPVDGKVVQGFSLIKDEVNNVVLSHKGQLYSTPAPMPVRAVFPGKVAFEGEISGYGQTLILDHGDHYYTVYAHLREVQVKDGEEVGPAQIMARSGFSEIGAGRGLYFEIRHFSEPTDPRQWLKGNQL
ncbi:MAG: peptidase M24 [Bdellovibrio sp. CG10_big_fil_rev_8_21_14_0_10_47_8]|nr:MAG: peptidase M24 [Bdellovibrio sp. CG10_big_fil_rev_8_21_14_0_10_47_8]